MYTKVCTNQYLVQVHIEADVDVGAAKIFGCWKLNNSSCIVYMVKYALLLISWGGWWYSVDPPPHSALPTPSIHSFTCIHTGWQYTDIKKFKLKLIFLFLALDVSYPPEHQRLISKLPLIQWICGPLSSMHYSWYKSYEDLKRLMANPTSSQFAEMQLI